MLEYSRKSEDGERKYGAPHREFWQLRAEPEERISIRPPEPMPLTGVSGTMRQYE
jgi:hypothetical protein